MQRSGAALWHIIMGGGVSGATNGDARAAFTKGVMSVNESLAKAASNGDEEEVKYRLAGGADADSTDRAGRTPLMLAASGGHDAVVNLLLERGADADARTPAAAFGLGGESALDMARHAARWQVVHTLERHRRTGSPRVKQRRDEL